MPGRRWIDDDQLLAALADAVHSAREVPPGFVEAGVAVPDTTDLDVEFAELLRDSSTHGGAPALAVTRAEAPLSRTLTFVAARLRIEIEVSGGTVRGQLVPPDAGELELQSTRVDLRRVDVDEVGWFVVEPVPVGSCRFRCSLPGGISVVTEWFVLAT